jgi:3D (Asp-Asp-Asp) domain-containing protein
MKRALRLMFGLWALAMLGLAGSPAPAVTTAAGPYYANPSWDQKLQCDTQATCPRFIVLSNWGNAAVLDRETGLVWQQSPDGTNTTNWEGAQFLCNDSAVGGRKGWRLSTLQELTSLVDPSVGFPGPTLPAGHPFSNVQSSYYWSATTFAGGATLGWLVALDTGGVVQGNKGDAHFFWCVRGGQGVDPQ